MVRFLVVSPFPTHASDRAEYQSSSGGALSSARAVRVSDWSSSSALESANESDTTIKFEDESDMTVKVEVWTPTRMLTNKLKVYETDVLTPTTMRIGELKQRAFAYTEHKGDPHSFENKWASAYLKRTREVMGEYDCDIKHDFASGYEHKCRFVKTCERPPRSNIEIFTVDHTPTLVTREYTELDDTDDGQKRRKVTKTETIRSRDVDVVAGYSSSRPNAVFHTLMLDKVLDEYGSVVKRGRGCVRCSADNCAEQHRNGRFYLKIARIKHERGYNFIHTFACPHHFKGQYDGAGRDERQCVCDASTNGKMETCLKIFDHNVKHRKNPNSSSRRRRGQYSFK